jgi:NADPH:quinone reductase
MMKAVLITKPGDVSVLQLQERAMRVAGEGEVLIRVKAAGVNRPDIAQRKGHYPPPPGASPDVPGLEVSGTIEAIGTGVTKWKIGDEVCALLNGGGYATYAVAHQELCLPRPVNLTLTEAASLPETVFTVWHNVFQRGRLQAGENFLVHGGTSGIGITAIQLAYAFGARVFATAGSKQKCDACINLGAHACINYNEEDFETALKETGIDVILDMIGGSYFAKNIKLLNADGRLVYINAMKGAETSVNIMDIMRKRLTITGSTLRNRDVAFKGQVAAEIQTHVWPLISTKQFLPVIYATFPLDKAAEAHSLMESSTHIGKILLTTDDQ